LGDGQVEQVGEGGPLGDHPDAVVLVGQHPGPQVTPGQLTDQ
jgi:hypothetical protein